MCVIAGYTGSRRAAPILIEMLKRVEYFDGGMATGIATIHEGKLYTAKLLGDVDTLLEKTDALNFPGTTGIIHSRPSRSYAQHAHPFTDESGEFAFCENGTYHQAMAPEYHEVGEAIMADLFARGVTFKSAFGEAGTTYGPAQLVLPDGRSIHNAEIYTQAIGAAVRGVPAEGLGDAIAKETAAMLSRLPAELVTLSVHARLPDTITVGRITRPMTVGFGEGETFLCTTALGFPAEVQARPHMPIPPTSMARITPSGVQVLGLPLPGVRVEQGDARVRATLRAILEERLTGRADAPLAMEEFADRDWFPLLWHEPRVDCHIAAPVGTMKETAAMVYEALWSFYREGRLRYTLGRIEEKKKDIMKFWLE